MTFASDETSVSDARPVELFEFIGTTTTYRYTSFQEDVVSNGNTYTALEKLSRNAIAAGTHSDDNATLAVSIPFNNALVSAYVFSVAPPSLYLNLYRAHRNDFDTTLLMWSGEVSTWTAAGRVVKMKVPTAFGTILQTSIPAPRYQNPCNHVLYDEYCTIDPTLFESARTVSSLSENIIVLDASPFADDLCNGGEMEFAAGGESRLIIDNVGTSFTVNYPFSGLAATDSVTIRQGCDRSFTTCKTKFSNGINFGGFPNIPGINPFEKSRL